MAGRICRSGQTAPNPRRYDDIAEGFQAVRHRTLACTAVVRRSGRRSLAPCVERHRDAARERVCFAAMSATRGVHLDLLPEARLDSDPSVLATVSFGARQGLVSAERVAITLPMPRLDRNDLAEVWRADEPVTRSTRDRFSLSRSRDVLIGATVTSDSCDLKTQAATTYKAALRLASDEGYPHIVRMWNHFPEIHAKEAGLERYKAFCAGRAEGFEDTGFSLGDDLPAASGVGTDGSGLVVMFIASRNPVRNVENPRQVSAFRYPEKYGPRSPSFARASVAEIAGHRQLFVSGTASIVGCESVHVGNVRLQMRETMENLRVICEVASDGRFRLLEELPGAVYRAYVRHADQYPTIREMFDEVVGPAAKSTWLRGDICREELLLEIELWTRL